MDMTLVIGVVGATLILIGFVANELGKLNARSLRYDLINLLGSLLLLWYGLQLAAWPFVILNTIWALVSLRDVILGLARKAKNR